VKFTGKKLNDLLSQPKLAVRSVLLYGPDQGLVRERTKIVAQKCVANLDDPFSVTEFAGSSLKQNASPLTDAAFSMSLGGGDCVILVREAADVITDSLNYIFDQPTRCWPILIEAGDLTPRSSLRKLYESKADLAIIACYPEEGRALEAFIRDFLAGENLTIEPAALIFLAASLAGDRQIVRRELEKLALYSSAKDTAADRVTESDVVACIGDSSETSLDNLVYSVGDGNQAAIDQTLSKAFIEGISPVAAIRAIQRHFQRLHFIRGQIQAGSSLDQALNRLRPPVFFKRKDDFQRQARNWSSENLGRALQLATDSEIDSKTTGLPAEILCSRTLIRIAQAARRR